MHSSIPQVVDDTGKLECPMLRRGTPTEEKGASHCHLVPLVGRITAAQKQGFKCDAEVNGFVRVVTPPHGGIQSPHRQAKAFPEAIGQVTKPVVQLLCPFGVLTPEPRLVSGGL